MWATLLESMAKSSVQRVFAILIESGALYCAIWVIQFRLMQSTRGRLITSLSGSHSDLYQSGLQQFPLFSRSNCCPTHCECHHILDDVRLTGGQGIYPTSIMILFSLLVRNDDHSSMSLMSSGIIFAQPESEENGTSPSPGSQTSEFDVELGVIETNSASLGSTSSSNMEGKPSCNHMTESPKDVET